MGPEAGLISTSLSGSQGAHGRARRKARRVRDRGLGALGPPGRPFPLTLLTFLVAIFWASCELLKLVKVKPALVILRY